MNCARLLLCNGMHLTYSTFLGMPDPFHFVVPNLSAYVE